MIKENRPSHRPLLRVGAAIASLGLALPACGTDGSSTEPTLPGKATTSIPSTTTTIELPTTTLEPKPSDVVEHRDGYDVLRNGGLLYEVLSAPEFGGFQINIEDNNQRYGLKEAPVGATPGMIGSEPAQDVLFRNLLWTFGAQHPEFINPEGGVDVEAYRAYLETNDWVDTVYLPDNISDPRDSVNYPPIIKSEPLIMDFKKPVILSNGDIPKEEGIDLSAGFFQYYYPTTTDNARNLLGLTPDGQLFSSFHIVDATGGPRDGQIMKVPLDQAIVNWDLNLGTILTITANLTNETDPQMQWIGPYATFWVPGGRSDPANIPDYDRLKSLGLDIFDFTTSDFKESKIFTPIN